MRESSPRLRIVYPPGAGRRDTFRRLADAMEVNADRMRREREALHEEYIRRSGPRPGDDRANASEASQRGRGGEDA